MNIITWNILANEFIKPSYYPKIKSSSLFDRQYRIERICLFLLREEHDIILLQEVMLPEYKLLTDIFKHDFIISKLVPVWNKSGNVTFLRKHKFSKIKHYPLQFGVYTQCKYNNNNLGIVNLHLDDVSVVKRRSQMAEVCGLLSDDNKSIICGDFNHKYKKNSAFYSQPGFTAHNKTNVTYYISEKMNIDNILSKGFKNVPALCEPYTVSDETTFNIYGSDHLPVWVELM